MIKTEDSNWKDLVFGPPCSLHIKGDNGKLTAISHLNMIPYLL